MWIDKSVGGVSAEEEDHIVKNGGFGICLDEEGGIYPENRYHSAIEKRFPKGSVSERQIYWAWGSKQANLMRGLPERFSSDQVMITGNPRFDLCKKELAGYHADLDQEISKLRPYILINTKFTPCNSRIYNGKQLTNDQRKSIEQSKMDMKSYFELISNLSKRYPDLNILIRPHPVEIAATYKDKFTLVPNVFVDDGRRPISRSSSCAKIVIHLDCTTAIEALFSGHHPISYLPNGVYAGTQTLPVEISEVTYTEDEVFRAIERRLIADPPTAAIQRALAKCAPVIANVQGTFLDRVRPVFERVDDIVSFRKEELNLLGATDRRRISQILAKQRLLRLTGKSQRKEPKFPPHNACEIEKLVLNGAAHRLVPRRAHCRWLSETLVSVEPSRQP
tara:strand:- start:22704 stop:23879 length:1176 start_codon:yes stop_codon:yes gene_type:complete